MQSRVLLALKESLQVTLLYCLFVCLSSCVCVGPDRSLNGILKKKKKAALIPALTVLPAAAVLPAASILHQIVVADGWLPTNYVEPVATIAAGAEKSYYYDGSLYYFFYEDLIGKFFFKDSTKYYTVLFDKTVIPSKSHYTADADAGDAAVEGETTDAYGDASADVSMDAEATTTAEATTETTVDTGGDGGYSASGDASGYGSSGYGAKGYADILSKKKKKKSIAASLISGATVAYG